MLLKAGLVLQVGNLTHSVISNLTAKLCSQSWILIKNMLLIWEM